MAAHFSFLDPDHPDELLQESLLILPLHGLTDPMMHIPGGLITNAEHPLHFLRRDSHFRRFHEVDHQELVGQRHVRIVEEGTRGGAELAPANPTLVKSPNLSGFTDGPKPGYIGGGYALGAARTIRPANPPQMLQARLFARELFQGLTEGRVPHSGQNGLKSKLCQADNNSSA